MKPKTVDEYIASCPKEDQEKLKQLRKLIQEAAPQAVERISYAMPYYDYKGRLAYFRLAKNHLALFIMTPTLEEHEDEIKQYDHTKATLRFPLNEDLPSALITKLIKARVKKTDETT